MVMVSTVCAGREHERFAAAEVAQSVADAEVARDHHSLDLGGALADLEDLRVAVEAPDRELVHEAVAAEDTKFAIAASFLNGSPRRILLAAWVIGQPRGVRSNLHVRDRKLDRLVVPDRVAERRALTAVAHALVDAAQPCASPTPSAAIAMRPSSRIRRNCAYPRPCSPSRFAAGTRQSVKDSPRVSEAFQPTFEYFGATEHTDRCDAQCAARSLTPCRDGAGGDRVRRRTRKDRYCAGLHRGAGRRAGL